MPKLDYAQCSSCGKLRERSWHFCWWCGYTTQQQNELFEEMDFAAKQRLVAHDRDRMSLRDGFRKGAW